MSDRVWTAYVHQEGDDLILPFPDDLIKEVGWKEGDVLVWEVDNDTGMVTLKKKPSWYHVVWSKIKLWSKK